MNQGKGKIVIWAIIILVIGGLIGYVIGRSVGNGNAQQASIFNISKSAKSVAKNPSSTVNAPGLVHISWNQGVCFVYSWNADNSTWKQIGVLNGIAQKDCHDMMPNPDGGTFGNVINMVWVDGLGCTVWRWEGDAQAGTWKNLGVSAGTNKENCHAAFPNPAGQYTNSGSTIYMVQWSSRNPLQYIMDNGDGTCTVTLSNGAHINGVPLFNSVGTFYGCDATQKVGKPMSTPTATPGVKTTTKSTVTTGSKSQ